MRWIGMEFSMRAPTTNISSTLLQWDRLRLHPILRFWAALRENVQKMERVRLDSGACSGGALLWSTGSC